MANNSKIEWTEATWNPVAGCSVISPGCTNCYAMRLARRLELIGQSKYAKTTRLSGGRPKWNGNVKLDYSALKVPTRWKRGRMIFVNSMSDLFHESVPVSFIQDVFSTMAATPQHTYQVLTKRAERVAEIAEQLSWLPNIWLGVSVENEEHQWRIEYLRKTAALTKFISLEPLLGPLPRLDLDDIDWAIAGGESGPGARPMSVDWVRSIRDQCNAAGVAFHFKQWGGVSKKKTGRLLDGRTWDEFPRQFHSSATAEEPLGLLAG